MLLYWQGRVPPQQGSFLLLNILDTQRFAQMQPSNLTFVFVFKNKKSYRVCFFIHSISNCKGALKFYNVNVELEDIESHLPSINLQPHVRFRVLPCPNFSQSVKARDVQFSQYDNKKTFFSFLQTKRQILPREPDCARGKLVKFMLRKLLVL